MTCLSAYVPVLTNVPTNLRKLTMGGQLPPPPPLATLVHFSHCHNRFDTYLYHCSLCCICKFNAGCLNAYDYTECLKKVERFFSRKSICENSLAKFLHLYV